MHLPIPETWEEARPQLVSVLRRATEPAHALAAEREADANRLLRRPFGPYHAELVMLDLEEVRVFVNLAHLQQWGVTSRQAFEAGREALRQAAAEGLRWSATHQLFHLDAPDGLASSRLLLDGWLAAFEGQVAGKPVAIAPTTRVVLIGGADDDSQLGRLLDLAEEGYLRAGSPLSPSLYTTDGAGRVVPLHLSPVHRRHARVEAAHRRLAVDVYRAQAEAWQPFEKARLADLQVALSTETGERFTLTRLSPDQDLWLPQADFVELEDDQGAFRVGFGHLQREAADLLRPLDLHPVRFNAAYPNALQLARLRAFGVAS